MKKHVLIFAGILMIAACQKPTKSTEVVKPKDVSRLQTIGLNTEQYERLQDIDDSELKKYIEVVYAKGENGESIPLLLTSDDNDLIQESKKNGFSYKLIDKDKYQNTKDISANNQENVNVANDEGRKYIGIYVIDRPVLENQFIVFQSGANSERNLASKEPTALNVSNYAVTQDWSDLGQTAMVQYVYTNHPDATSDIVITVRYKDCGFCSKYDLYPHERLTATTSPVPYYVPTRIWYRAQAKRLYVTVYSNYGNANVTIN